MSNRHCYKGQRPSAAAESAAAAGAAPPPSPSGRVSQPLPGHPVRVALLDLLAEVGTVTATEAAVRLGHSSGLCSFRLRQPARYGLIEEAPHDGGRARPWRLRWTRADDRTAGGTDRTAEFTVLARGLEDESYQRWLARRERLPREWQDDFSFSAVLYLTPAQTQELAAVCWPPPAGGVTGTPAHARRTPWPWRR